MLGDDVFGLGGTDRAAVGVTLINVPARLASTGRRTVMHLPDGWPWHDAWTDLWNTATGPPAAA